MVGVLVYVYSNHCVTLHQPTSSSNSSSSGSSRSKVCTVMFDTCRKIKISADGSRG